MKLPLGLALAILSVAPVSCSSAVPAVPVLPSVGTQDRCVPTGQWVTPESGEKLTSAALTDRVATRRVVLLGEQHDRAEHHRWQLQTLAALHAKQPSLVIGFEVFPRRLQETLDRWVGGELGEREFLGRVEWKKNSSLPPDLYLPLFHFARMNRVPMVALNVDRSVIARIGEKGWDAVPEEERGGLSQPAPPGPEYKSWLEEVYEEHLTEEDEEVPEQETTGEGAAGVQGFIDAQLAWDRAFAEALQSAVTGWPDALVVGIIGSGHLENGYGVSHQLADLGVTDVAVLLPWDQDRECDALTARLADAVFGLEGDRRTVSRPLLGVSIMAAASGVHVMEVLPGSVAETAGLQPGDVIVSAGGLELRETTELVELVAEQRPGGHLLLRVQRNGVMREFVAEFPETP